MDDPPEEAYGRVTNPERFAPLMPAAEELIRDLASRFDVTISRGPAAPSKSKTVAILETVRITPARTDQAPLTITFTSFPGLYLDAGAWQHIALPSCGCDACSEDAESTLRELAEYSEALTAGQLSERITGNLRPVLEHSWEGNGWGRSGESSLSREKAANLRAGPVQPPADGRWMTWSTTLPS
ncbi:DUF6226 family protein [Rhodococcus sp. KBS0724]|uniref:DUF6226 family protein n=1 Tax=Rhodococcus sp. KBS0724 TaxID=1179674 RepID=UPI00163DB088|nr:DUF6226 family protein [Rhodococcus sp. KBS0724]